MKLPRSRALRVPLLFGRIVETEHDAPVVPLAGHAERAHEERRVVHGEVGPVVAVREDVPTVVGVPRDPSVERGQEPLVLDQAPLVPEPALGVEAQGALARPAFGRREAEEVGMVAGFAGLAEVHGPPAVFLVLMLAPVRPRGQAALTALDEGA